MSESDPTYAPRRKALKVAIASLSTEAGYGSAENSALETLTEMLQSYLIELGRSTRAFCELSGRTEAMLSDVVMALVEMGLSVDGIAAHARRSTKSVFMPPSQAPPTQSPKILQIGEKKLHPSYVPDYLPSFPDPHTYIKTPTHKSPADEYQLIREKAASQKRDVERALTRFIAKTGDTQSLFPDDPLAYPLIAVKSSPLPHLNALLPKDQDLDSQDQSDTEQQSKTQDKMAKQKSEAAQAQNSEAAAESMDTSETIDNPYLRPTKMPRGRRKIKP